MRVSSGWECDCEYFMYNIIGFKVWDLLVIIFCGDLFFFIGVILNVMIILEVGYKDFEMGRLRDDVFLDFFIFFKFGVLLQRFVRLEVFSFLILNLRCLLVFWFM